jgi:hypothetical protein
MIKAIWNWFFGSKKNEEVLMSVNFTTPRKSTRTTNNKSRSKKRVTKSKLKEYRHQSFYTPSRSDDSFVPVFIPVNSDYTPSSDFSGGGGDFGGGGASSSWDSSLSNMAKLTESQVASIKKELKNYHYGLGAKLARKYNVTKTAISAIKTSKNWRHL